MTWSIGPITLSRAPTSIRDRAPQQIKGIVVSGFNPYVYPLGVNIQVLTLEWLYLPNKEAIELKELARNLGVQPIRIVGENEYQGFYYINVGVTQAQGGNVNTKRVRIECYKVGGLGYYQHGLRITDLSEVTNDWDI